MPSSRKRLRTFCAVFPQSSQISGLPSDVNIFGKTPSVSQSTRVTDRQTDRQTDGNAISIADRLLRITLAKTVNVCAAVRWSSSDELIKRSHSRLRFVLRANGSEELVPPSLSRKAAELPGVNSDRRGFRYLAGQSLARLVPDAPALTSRCRRHVAWPSNPHWSRRIRDLTRRLLTVELTAEFLASWFGRPESQAAQHQPMTDCGRSLGIADVH